MPAHVADDDAQRSVGQLQIVEKVPGRVLGRIGSARQFDARHVRSRLGAKMLLDPPRGDQLRFLFFEHLLGLLAADRTCQHVGNRREKPAFLRARPVSGATYRLSTPSNCSSNRIGTQ